MIRRLPFYAYSSNNKRGNRPHPTVMQRREAALNMYWEHRTIEEISVSLDIAYETVRRYIRHARRMGDERVQRRTGIKRIMQAQARRNQIMKLAGHGYTPLEISKLVNCHVRLIQMRIHQAKEASVVDVST